MNRASLSVVCIVPPARKRRAEFAGNKGIQGAEARGKLDDGQTTLIVEAVEKVCRRKITFLRVAFPAAGDQVAVGILLQVGKRDDMVDAAAMDG